MVELFANSGDPSQTACSVASDLGLHCLPVTHLGGSSLQWVNIMWSVPLLSLSRATDNFWAFGYFPPHNLINWVKSYFHIWIWEKYHQTQNKLGKTLIGAVTGQCSLPESCFACKNFNQNFNINSWPWPQGYSCGSGWYRIELQTHI